MKTTALVIAIVLGFSIGTAVGLAVRALVAIARLWKDDTP